MRAAWYSVGARATLSETAVVRAIDRPRAARGQELPGVGLLRQGARAAGRVN